MELPRIGLALRLRARDAIAAGTILGAASLGSPGMERMKNPSQCRRLGVCSRSGCKRGTRITRGGNMRKQDLIRLVMCVALAAAPMMIPTIATGQAPVPPPAAPAPPPQMPPSLVPAHVVDLMTTEGSAAFSAQWKSM